MRMRRLQCAGLPSCGRGSGSTGRPWSRPTMVPGLLLGSAGSTSGASAARHPPPPSPLPLPPPHPPHLHPPPHRHRHPPRLHHLHPPHPPRLPRPGHSHPGQRLRCRGPAPAPPLPPPPRRRPMHHDHCATASLLQQARAETALRAGPQEMTCALRCHQHRTQPQPLHQPPACFGPPDVRRPSTTLGGFETWTTSPTARRGHVAHSPGCRSHQPPPPHRYSLPSYSAQEQLQ
mmetsp:Transcript_3960/g.12624  ORF Transcript_3960/g.12624 Transcript_3960/m.12624 type:complete len:232 (+) Transcript_3960:89-784(+)